LLALKSHTNISTSLLSILEESKSKELIKSFENTQNAKLLFLSTKGFNRASLLKIKAYEKALLSVENIEKQKFKQSQKLYTHLQEYKVFSTELNHEKLKALNVQKELKNLHQQMISSFFPAPIDAIDPFGLFTSSKTTKIHLKNGHLTLGEYGYLSVFTLRSKTLEEHQILYRKIHNLVDEKEAKIFSPLFYFVENSNAIHSDVDNIILLAGLILLLLYFIVLRDIFLLFNTLTTLATSAMISTIIMGLLFKEISIFVFVFGVSISSIAIDYMFHHYLHGYYVKKTSYNKEVLFGFLTTISAFFILSFSSFLLIQQIALFALFSLIVSYLQFAFLYPYLGFKSFELRAKQKFINLKVIKPKILLLFSFIVIIAATSWLKFDSNIRNLDYDNHKLKSLETFFSKKLMNEEKQAFVIKAKDIDTLIVHARNIKKNFPSITLPLSQLIDSQTFIQRTKQLKILTELRTTLQKEADTLKFKKDYFQNAYGSKIPIFYSQEQIQSFGIDILKIDQDYISYGHINKKNYKTLLAYDFIESISLKEQFEASLQSSMQQLLRLGALSICIIVLLLYIFTKRAFFYALLFLIFPISLIALYAYFIALNILHIFMMFIILAIGIDYAIYLANEPNRLTKQAIAYSLVSTFAGFGVLVFSNINALFSLGVVATIGIVAIFILLIFMKGESHEA